MKINEAVAKRVEQLLEKQSRTQYAIRRGEGRRDFQFHFLHHLIGQMQESRRHRPQYLPRIQYHFGRVFQLGIILERQSFRRLKPPYEKKRAERNARLSFFVFNDLAPM